MKGLLKIYHPDETLKYNLKNTYCKAVYSNKQHFLEVEVITDDSLDEVEDDSLRYRFPQISLSVYDFPLDSGELEGCSVHVEDSDDESFTEVDLYDDDEAYLYDNHLQFENNENGTLQLVWSGKIDDFYTGSDEPIPFKLKCIFNSEDDYSEDE